MVITPAANRFFSPVLCDNLSQTVPSHACRFSLLITLSLLCDTARAEPPLVRIPKSSPVARTAFQQRRPSSGFTTQPPSTPAATLQAPSWDPYATNPQAGAQPPSTFTPPGVIGPPANTQFPPPTAPPPLGVAPGAPYIAYPGAAPPNSLFPEGWSPGNWLAPNLQSATPNPNALGNSNRVVYAPRLRHTWLVGGQSDRQLQSHDTDFSLPFSFPDFLLSNEPLFVIPSFSLHLWQGPRNDPPELPSKAYSLFIDSSWFSDPNHAVGLEIGVRTGFFSDFQTFNSQSFRILGQGLLRLRVTPQATIKAGVVYLDRLDLKLLPAAGLIWESDDQARFDLYFPKPKISQYWTSIGNYDLWWYLAGEYGGGSWTIERIAMPPVTENEYSDQIDINDVRLILGMEWGSESELRLRRRRGFLEMGWVTGREVLYRDDPSESFRMNDTFMIRAGILR